MKKISYFDQVSNSYQNKSHRGPFRLIRQFEKKSVLNFVQGLGYKKMLELGCGAGFYTKPLSSQAQEVWVNEKSESMLNQLSLPNSKKILGDMSQIEIQNEFDFICILGALEFVESPDQVLFKSSNWLKPDGHILLMLPRRSFAGHVYRLFHWLKGNSVFLFDEHKIQKSLEGLNIRVVKNKNVFPFNMLILGKRAAT